MPAPLIAGLLPRQVRIVEADDQAWDRPLHPVEEESLGTGAVPARRREFAAGRHCARRALSLLGLPETPVPRRGNRAPQWPRGVTGSLTHCAGYCAAAVAWRTDVPAVGIDAEVHQPLPEGVADIVCVGEEAKAVGATTPHSRVHWPTVVFSAKESFFKAWYPLTGHWLEFLDVELLPAARPGVLVPLLRAPGADQPSGLTFEIRFRVTASHVLSAAFTRTRHTTQEEL